MVESCANVHREKHEHKARHDAVHRARQDGAQVGPRRAADDCRHRSGHRDGGEAADGCHDYDDVKPNVHGAGKKPPPRWGLSW